jgi:hypothetical protein
LDSVLHAESSRVDTGVAVLKKAQDLAKQQGMAMVDMIEKSVPPADGRLLDVYA